MFPDDAMLRKCKIKQSARIKEEKLTLNCLRTKFFLAIIFYERSSILLDALH